MSADEGNTRNGISKAVECGLFIPFYRTVKNGPPQNKEFLRGPTDMRLTSAACLLLTQNSNIDSREIHTHEESINQASRAGDNDSVEH